MLAEYGTVETILLNDNPIDDKCVDALGNYLSSNQYITTLGLAETKMSNEGVKTLTKYLDGNKTLRNLYFLRTNSSNPDLSNHDVAKLYKNSRIESLIDNEINPYRTRVVLIPGLKNKIRNGNGQFINLFSMLVFLQRVIYVHPNLSRQKQNKNRDTADDDLIDLADLIKDSEHIDKIVSVV